MRRELVAEVDLDSALHNFGRVSARAGGLPVIAVVKADAYGHGATELSRIYERAGVGSLAVAFLSEAVELREAGIRAPILVLFETSNPERFPALNLTPVIHDLKTAGAFSRLASSLGRELDVHLNVDTGMGREGLDGAGDALKALALGGLRVTGLMSHFSDADLGDIEFVKLQIERFGKVKDALAARGVSPTCHLANSAALCAHPASHMDAVRPGLVLYGVSPFGADPPPASGCSLGDFRPVMSVKARVVGVRNFKAGQTVSYSRTFITKRPTRAALIAAGYADGYSRHYSNCADVLIGGVRAPVIGRVCMDLSVVDVTGAGDVEVGDMAVLLGADGDERITALELASKASTIPYEVLLSLGLRAKRVFRGGQS